MSLSLDTLLFDGTNRMTSGAFVRGIRQYALERDRPDDDTWIAHVAASYIDGGALDWYEDLTQETQESWRMLRRALLKRWPNDSGMISQDSPGSSSVVPTPAKAPLHAPAAPAAPAAPTSSNIPLIGRIKAVLCQEGTHLGYLSSAPDTDGDFIVRQETESAMVVMVMPGDSPQNIKIVMQGSTSEDVLGLIWSSSQNLVDDLNNQTGRWATPTAVKLRAGPQGTEPYLSRNSPHTGPIAFALWNILMDGTIVVAWQGPGGAQYALHGEVITSAREFGGIVFVNSRAREPLAISDNNFKSYDLRKARLVFEPI